ncbi:MAG: TIGR03936 family radical SAM-associated protein [Brevefilum sp.]
MMTQNTDITRIRVRYSKGNSLRFTGHLDMQRIWERTLRRSGLPVRYTQGYHPRARLNLASALPLGFISEDELLDFWLDQPQALDEIHRRLAASAPPGLVIRSIEDIALGEDALQVQMKASEFSVTFFDPINGQELARQVHALLDQDEIIMTRRKKSYDLRPLILGLEVITHAEGEPGLWMRLLAEPGATGRPDDVLVALGFPNTDYLVCRKQIILA